MCGHDGLGGLGGQAVDAVSPLLQTLSQTRLQYRTRSVRDTAEIDVPTETYQSDTTETLICHGNSQIYHRNRPVRYTAETDQSDIPRKQTSQLWVPRKQTRGCLTVWMTRPSRSQSTTGGGAPWNSHSMTTLSSWLTESNVGGNTGPARRNRPVPPPEGTQTRGHAGSRGYDTRDQRVGMAIRLHGWRNRVGPGGTFPSGPH